MLLLLFALVLVAALLVIPLGLPGTWVMLAAAFGWRASYLCMALAMAPALAAALLAPEPERDRQADPAPLDLRRAVVEPFRELLGRLGPLALPTLLLGGDPADPDEAFASWEKALALPSVKGLIVGRTLLYPPDDDVAGAVATAVAMVR